MYIMSVYSSEYMHSRNQDIVQMCRYLVQYDFLLICYFYCCVIALVMKLTIVVIILLTPKRNLYLNIHWVSAKSVPKTSKFLIIAMFVTAELTTGFHIYRYNYSVYLYRRLCVTTVTVSKTQLHYLSYYHINITLTQSYV